MMQRAQRGFTLVEMLLSVVIIGIITAVTVPLYGSFLARNDLDIMSQRTAEALRRAQVYARGMKNDSAWSVEIQASTITLFKGTNFAGRDQAFDETMALPGTVTASGLAEVRFAALTGLPHTTGDITLTTSTAGETKQVNVNAVGMVSY